MAAKTVATAEETRAETGNIIRLEHGCPNCGKPWEEPDPNPSNTVPIEEPGQEKTSLEVCPDCSFERRRIKKKRIITTLRGLGWSRTKLRALDIGLEKFLRQRTPFYS